jgi:hypothetical protein
MSKAIEAAEELHGPKNNAKSNEAAGKLPYQNSMWQREGYSNRSCSQKRRSRGVNTQQASEEAHRPGEDGSI